MGDLDGALNGGHRHFELQHQHRGALDDFCMRINARWRERAIGASGEDDTVLTDVFDENHGDAGSGTRGSLGLL